MMSRLPLSVAKILMPMAVVAGVFVLVAASARPKVMRQAPAGASRISTDHDSVVARVDRLFAKNWADARITPANPADDLTVLRRLSLVLHGTVPSLEEIRVLEADLKPDRMQRWVERMLTDRRFADYFARRLARVYIGTEEGQLLLFRRDRFWAWLSEQFQKNRPYDEIVQGMISDRGLWTGAPEVNFVTAALNEGMVDVDKLAGRTARAFLGQRIDCAQCHDADRGTEGRIGRFTKWKQTQFEGLAACFGKVSISAVGVEDNRKEAYTVLDRMTSEKREVAADVPYNSEWMLDEGTERQRLAAWITHAENRRFERAIVNRIWGLMFGRAWVMPVDDIPDPHEEGRQPDDLLDVLGADFREHNCDLKRLISNIAATHVFRLSSDHPDAESSERAPRIDKTWAAFPVTRLRPEQVIGAMLQATSLKTIDQNSHWVSRTFRFLQELEFVKEYGDLGDNELAEHSGTIPQALLRMNGKFAKDRSEGTPFSAPGRIAGMSPSADECLDLCFLVCLTRRPTADERAQLLSQLEVTGKDARKNAVEDIFWTLYNSAEFCWGH